MRGWRLNRRRWAVVRQRVLERDRWRCVQCSRPGRLEVDHIRALHRDGDEWSMQNLQTLCRPCHFKKSRREQGTLAPEGSEAWRERIASQVGDQHGV